MQIPHHLCKTTGLTAHEAEENRASYGANLLPHRKRTSFLKKLLSGFSDPIIRILLGALLINCLFLFHTFDIMETLGIAAAILCATVISALSEQGGERAFEKLREEESRTRSLVRRETDAGHFCDVSLPTEEIVAGDLVSLSAGERIPADGILVRGNLRVSMAALNGEGKDCTRTPQKLFSPTQWLPEDPRLLFRGATVTNGEGQMLCMRVGGDTLFGQLSGEMQSETRESPMRARLSRLARQMSFVGYAAAAAAALSYLFHTFYIDAGGTMAGMRMLLSDPRFVFSALTHALMLATTMIVVAVPEGLPMMISVVLSSNIRRMQRDHVLVRKPVGIETAGSLNLLFCDKTGTLTRGMPVVSSIVLGDGSAFSSLSAFRAKAPIPARHYMIGARCNTQSRIVTDEKTKTPHAGGGNATDRALLDHVLALSPIYWSDLPGRDDVCRRVPFDSEKKYSLAAVGDTVYIKGAPEVLLPGCSTAFAADGSRQPIDRARIRTELTAITARAGRVLAVCVEMGGERTLLCLVSIRDDLRKEARAAVRELQGAGIRVVMITGDNRETAAAIAKEAGILPPNAGEDAVLTSEMLALLDDAALAARLPSVCVIARALPGDKSRLVRIAQEHGLTVGMTGDGVNDAPALKAADVGFALGGGTEVAREAGDIVILDDNIASIAKAVLYGRTIFKSIRKFIMFQMTTNLTAVGISVLCPLIGIETPVTVLQMLWVNLIMDTLGSLAFAGEAPSPDTMRERPKQRGEAIMNRYMVERIVLVGAYLLLLCLGFVHSEGMREHFGFYEDPVRFLGAFFALFIFADIANSVSARTTHVNPLHRLSHNPAFLAIFSGIIAVQLCIIYRGGSVFRTYPLSPGELGLVLSLSATVLLYCMIVKGIMRRRFGGETV